MTEVHCTYDPATRGGNTPDGRKVKGTIHWVSAEHAIDAEVRLYDNLFTKEDPNQVEEGQDFTANLNPNSLEVVRGAKLEPSLKGASPGSRMANLARAGIARRATSIAWPVPRCGCCRTVFTPSGATAAVTSSA